MKTTGRVTRVQYTSVGDSEPNTGGGIEPHKLSPNQVC